MTLPDRIAYLIVKHGSLRAVALILGIDHVYLSRLASGEKSNAGEKILRRMGLRKVVTYELKESKK